AIGALMEKWGDAAIAIDRDVAARFPIRLPLTIVHNSVSPPPAEANGVSRKGSLGLPEDRVAVGFAGFVRRQKGWPELVSAAEILVEEGAPAHFVIMGGGVRPPEYFRTVRGRALAAANLLTDEESAIKELVAQKRLGPHFSFLPFTAETGEIYSALDVVTFPNQGVGLGRPVLAQGLPPVGLAGQFSGSDPIGLDGVPVARLRRERVAPGLRAAGRGGMRRQGPLVREARGLYRLLRLARMTSGLYRTGRIL